MHFFSIRLANQETETNSLSLYRRNAFTALRGAGRAAPLAVRVVMEAMTCIFLDSSRQSGDGDNVAFPLHALVVCCIHVASAWQAQSKGARGAIAAPTLDW